jgi:hypothetical protein
MFYVYDMQVMLDTTEDNEVTPVKTLIDKLGHGGYVVSIEIGDVHPVTRIKLFAYSLEQLEMIGQALGSGTEHIVAAIAEAVTA